MAVKMPSDTSLDIEQAICPLGTLGCDGSYVFGGKAESLGRLIRLGFPVPDGFAIAAEVYGSAVQSLGLERLWQDAGGDEDQQGHPATLDHLKAPCTRLRTAIQTVSLPKGIHQAIARLYARMGDQVPVAVRSAAVGEDSAAHSYAGQHASFLGVQGHDAVLDAIRRCWASLFTPHALRYRLRVGIGPLDDRMGVVVQRMVNARVAGVAFSADLSGRLDGRVLIDAVSGLADGLVSGRRAPTEAEVEPDGRVRRRASGDADLTDGLAQDVAALVRRVAVACETPQDVEWAYDGAQVWVVQARPLTVPVARPDEDTRVIIWTGANLQEAIPEPLTSLSEEASFQFINTTIRLSFDAFGMASDPHERCLMVYQGRFYMNYSAFASWASVLPGVNLSQLFLQYGDAPNLIERLAFRPRSKLRYLVRLPVAFLTLIGWTLFADRRVARVVEKNEQRIALALRIAVPETPDEVLGRTFDAFAPDTEVLGAFGVVGGLAMTHLADVQIAAMKTLPGLDSATAWAATAGIDMASAAMGRRLARLADRLRDDPVRRQRLEQAFAAGQNGMRVLNEPEFAAFRTQFDAFMHECGHRTENEPELSQPRWRERPHDVLRRVIQLAQTPPRDIRPEAARSPILDRVSGLTRWRLRKMIERAQFWQSRREALRSAVIRQATAGRAFILEIGRRLAERGVLAKRDDVFYLLQDELKAILLGQQRDPHHILGLILERRREHERLRRIPDPPRLLAEMPDGQLLPFDGHGTAGPAQDGTILTGFPVSPGRAAGPARVLSSPDEAETLQPGEILVTRVTDVAWSPLFLIAAGVVTDIGAPTSHASIVAREFGIPAVVNVHQGTRRIKTGDWLTVDGSSGRVWIGKAVTSDQ